jgi:hypothetical protein
VLKEFVMRMPNAAKAFFHFHKTGPKQHEEPSIFDSGIGDWVLDLAALALIALVIGTIIRWAYVAVFH